MIDLCLLSDATMVGIRVVEILSLIEVTSSDAIGSRLSIIATAKPLTLSCTIPTLNA